MSSSKSENIATSSIIKLSQNPADFGSEADELSADMFVSALPVQHSHSYFECEETGIYIGVWDTTDMVETAGPYSCDEFMVIIEGAVEIKNNKTGIKQTVLAGESFIIPQGYDCQWHQSGYLRKFYVISEPPTQTIPETPVVESIIKLQPNQTGHQYQHNNFAVGIIEGDEVNSDLQQSVCHTFYFVTRGELVLTQTNGATLTCRAGDAFFIPKGTHYHCNATALLVLQYVEL